jgi:hypothetical protein
MQKKNKNFHVYANKKMEKDDDDGNLISSRSFASFFHFAQNAFYPFLRKEGEKNCEFYIFSEGRV